MRRTFGMIALLAALASGQALAQDQQQQLQQQQDRQQRDLEEQRQQITPIRGNFRAMADEARRRAEQAKDPDSKAQWLKVAKRWDDLSRN